MFDVDGGTGPGAGVFSRAGERRQEMCEAGEKERGEEEERGK